MDNTERTLDIDYLTAKEKRNIRAEMARYFDLLQKHDCKLAYKGYCKGCAEIYTELNKLQSELRARS